MGTDGGRVQLSSEDVQRKAAFQEVPGEAEADTVRQDFLQRAAGPPAPPRSSAAALASLRGPQGARPGSVAAGARTITALQRLVGNQAVVQLLARSASAAPGGAARVQRVTDGQPLVQRDADGDIKDLQKTAAKKSTPEALKTVIADAVEASDRVTEYKAVPGGGSAVRLFNRGDMSVEGYIVNCQMNAKDKGERLGNLVHELTHVAVSEKYGRDFLNYEDYGNEGKVAPEKELTQQPITVHGQEFGVLKNEEAVQTALQSKPVNDALLDQLEGLKAKVGSAGLKKDKQKQVEDKILYDMINVSKEYDTVLNQILLWCQFWGAKQDTDFYRGPTSLVNDAHRREAAAEE